MATPFPLCYCADGGSCRPECTSRIELRRTGGGGSGRLQIRRGVDAGMLPRVRAVVDVPGWAPAAVGGGVCLPLPGSGGGLRAVVSLASTVTFPMSLSARNGGRRKVQVSQLRTRVSSVAQ